MFTVGSEGQIEEFPWENLLSTVQDLGEGDSAAVGSSLLCLRTGSYGSGAKDVGELIRRDVEVNNSGVQSSIIWDPISPLDQ